MGGFRSKLITIKNDADKALREVYLPSKHVYFPQLMEITLDRGVQVILDRGLAIDKLHQGQREGKLVGTYFNYIETN